MKARLVIAVSGCLLAGALVVGSSELANAQTRTSTPTTIKSTRLPVSAATNAGAIWGDDQNVFVLVGDHLFKVRKYDMKVDGSVALRTTNTMATAAQHIKVKKLPPLKKTVERLPRPKRKATSSDDE